MKKIIDVSTKEEIKFTKADLPILIHGKEHSGASLFSITIASLLHASGIKLCIFTAYTMAKEEFLKQIKNPETVFYLEDENNIKQSLKFQTIIVQSGNIDLFMKIISDHSIMSDRIIFIKNIETINKPILQIIAPYPFVVSGDLEINPAQNDFNSFVYNTKILFSPISGEIIPSLEKYRAFMKNKSGNKIITLS